MPIVERITIKYRKAVGLSETEECWDAKWVSVFMDEYVLISNSVGKISTFLTVVTLKSLTIYVVKSMFSPTLTFTQLL